MADEQCLPVFVPASGKINPIYSDNYLRSVLHDNVLKIGSDIDNEIAQRIEPKILDAVKKAKECIRYECCQRMEFALDQERKVWQSERFVKLEDFSKRNNADLYNVEHSLKDYKIKLTKAMLRIVKIKTKNHLKLELEKCLQHVEKDFQMVLQNVLNLQQDNFGDFLNKFVSTQSCLFISAFRKMLLACFKKMQLARNDMLCSDLAQEMHIICKKSLDSASFLRHIKQDIEHVASQVFDVIQKMYVVNPRKDDKCHERLQKMYCLLGQLKQNPAISRSTKRWLGKFEFLLKEDNLQNASIFVNWDGSCTTDYNTDSLEDSEGEQESGRTYCEHISSEPAPSDKDLFIEWDEPVEDFEVLCPEVTQAVELFENKVKLEPDLKQVLENEDEYEDEDDQLPDLTDLINLILKRTFAVVEKDEQLIALIESIVASNDLSEKNLFDTIELLNQCELTYAEITAESFAKDFITLLNSFLINLREFADSAQIRVNVHESFVPNDCENTQQM